MGGELIMILVGGGKRTQLVSSCIMHRWSREEDHVCQYLPNYLQKYEILFVSSLC